MDVKHPALKSKTAISAGAAWRDAEAALSVAGIDYDTFSDLPRDHRLTILAQYEIKWRVEALHAWENEQRRQANAKRNAKPKKMMRHG